MSNIGIYGNMKNLFLLLTMILSSPILVGQNIEMKNLEFKKEFNYNTLSFNHAFTSAALMITDGNTVHQNEEEILQYFQQMRTDYGQIDSIHTFDIVQGNDQISYELGKMDFSNAVSITYLTIWKDDNDSVKRALLYFTKSEEAKLAKEEISIARNQWMEYCNAHNAFALVKNAYTENALYFNHKPLVIGTEALAKEYGYMNNEKYTLKLTPEIIQPATKQIVYEIGQCSGSYNGKYVLVWEKEHDGTWRICFDSNI